MREKLNENPMYQVAIIGVLALVVGFMILHSMSGPKAGTSQPDLGVTPAQDADAPGGAAPAVVDNDIGAVPNGAQSAPNASAPAPAPTDNGGGGAPAVPANGNGSGFVAGPGLPKDVANAYDNGKVIAVLVVRRPAIDDTKLVPMVEELKSRGDTAAFIVKAYHVSQYSRITQGVNVDRTPALVVVQPKRLTQGPLPNATVSYGYRGKQTVDQAIRDAEYSGRTNLPYYPTK